MRIDELKRIAKENDYELTKSNVHYKLTHKYCENNITINCLCKNRLWISIPFHCDERDFNMIKAAVKFAETPPEDKEEEKVYFEHKLLKSRKGKPVYLALKCKRAIEFLTVQGSKEDIDNNKVHFTREEIESIKERFDTDLADFKEVEVEE